jgi:putative DNA methylase
MYTWGDAFTERQLLALSTFSDLIREATPVIYSHAVSGGLSERPAQAYADAVTTYLALALGRSANYWSSFTTWAGSFIKQTFGRQAIPMVWDFSEANPFSERTGNWSGALDWITKCLNDSIPAIGTASVYQADAGVGAEYQNKFLVSTDPPYYDNVGYADLSDFFYVWLRPTIGDTYPELFSTILTPKSREIISAPHRFGGSKKKAEEHFLTCLDQAFANMSEYADSGYPTTIYYAFKQSEQERVSGGEGTRVASTGWEAMLEGLLQSRYRIVGTWPIRTERDRGLKSGTNVLASSIVLVCRPRAEEARMASRQELVSSLRRELPPALRDMQSGNIAPVDLAQASIGPGMAVYSRYSKVLEPDGSRMTVRTALQLINHELDAYLAEQEGYIDEDSRFAVAWFEQFGFQGGPFGQADVLARAKNTSVDGLAYAGVLESGAGKVRLLRWSELDPGWDPTTDKRLTTWEATHHLIERLNTHGEEGAAMLLARLPADLAAQARQLAYRLYSICERKGWAEQARDYNALVISWGASQEQAREYRQRYQQSRMFE